MADGELAVFMALEGVADSEIATIIASEGVGGTANGVGGGGSILFIYFASIIN